MHRKLKVIRLLHQVPSRQFSSGPSPFKHMPYMDSNDNLGGFMSAIPKDIGNIAEGIPTYGLWEYFQFCDTICFDWWMYCADVN